MTKPSKSLTRCHWATNELSIPYHDQEWGVPTHDDRRLFEFLILEGAQAGLSWDTILKKRASYRAAFEGFDPARIARYDRRKIQTLLRQSRHRPQSPEDRFRGRQRKSVPPGAGGIWLVRPLHLAIRGRETAHQPLDFIPANSRKHARVGGDEQSPEERRLQFCRPYHLLRVHAGRRHDERPPGRLLPLPAAGRKEDSLRTASARATASGSP